MTFNEVERGIAVARVHPPTPFTPEGGGHLLHRGELEDGGWQALMCPEEEENNGSTPPRRVQSPKPAKRTPVPPKKDKPRK